MSLQVVSSQHQQYEKKGPRQQAAAVRVLAAQCQPQSRATTPESLSLWPPKRVAPSSLEGLVQQQDDEP